MVTMATEIPKHTATNDQSQEGEMMQQTSSVANSPTAIPVLTPTQLTELDPKITMATDSLAQQPNEQSPGDLTTLDLSPSRFIRDIDQEPIDLGINIDGIDGLTSLLNTSLTNLHNTNVNYSAIWEDSSEESLTPPSKIRVVSPSSSIAPTETIEIIDSEWETSLVALVTAAREMEALHHDDALLTVNEVTTKFNIINTSKLDNWSQDKLNAALAVVPHFTKPD
jgi:hypothetical protein